MAKVEPMIQIAQPYSANLNFVNPHGEFAQEMLLPHEIFATLYENERDAFNRCILGPPGKIDSFWNRMKNVPHPSWPGHPLATRDLSKAVPISVHGDECPISGIGKQWCKKMLNVSWSSMVGKPGTKTSQHWSFGLIEKTGVPKGPQATLPMLWKIFAWSLQCLWLGMWPTHDFRGQRPGLGVKSTCTLLHATLIIVLAM